MRGNRYPNDVATINGLGYYFANGSHFLSTYYRQYDLVWDREQRLPYLHVVARDVDQQNILRGPSIDVIPKIDLGSLICPIGRIAGSPWASEQRWIASFPFRDEDAGK